MRGQRNEATNHNVIMIMRFFRAGLCLSMISLLPAQQTPPADDTIRLTVQQILAPVTVLNRDGSYVNGLEPQHFHLLDNGKPQNITVDVAFQPVSLVIAIQSNDQVEGMLPAINRIGGLIGPLVIGEQGEAAVMAFDHRFRKMQDFTSDPAKIADSIKKITPGSTTSRMIDAVIESVRMLRSRPANHRRILLLITETQDKGSESRVREALTDVQLHNVSVYSVNISRAMAGLLGRRQPPRPDTRPPASSAALPPNVPATPNNVMQATGSEGGSAQFVPLMVEIFKDVKKIFVDNPVEVFTKGTGGTEYSYAKQKGLEEAIAKIGEEIHSQYLISYQPNNKQEAGFHEIEVQVSSPGVRVRTRPGYWMGAQ